MTYETLALWKSTKSLAKLAAVLLDISMVKFLDLAVREKIERDEILIPKEKA